jgi:hypothetical protein
VLKDFNCRSKRVNLDSHLQREVYAAAAAAAVLHKAAQCNSVGQDRALCCSLCDGGGEG